MKKVLTGLVAAVVLITAAAYNLIYTTAADGDKTGSCGESVTWSFDETTGVLTILGTGDMYTNYVPYEQWGYYQYKDDITEVIVEEGITYISECAFGPFDPNFTLYRGSPVYSKLTKLTLPSSVKSIGQFAFYKTALTSVTLPEGLEEIGDAAFSHTPLSGDLILPKSLNNLGQYAFSNTNISSANLNEGMKLGGGAFRDCDSLKEVTIPCNVHFIFTTLTASNAGRPNCGFAQCDSLEKVIIQGGGTVEKYGGNMENGLGEGLFSQCPSLKEVEIETEDIEYVATNGSEGPTFDITNNPTFMVYKGSTTEQTLKDAGFLTSKNTEYKKVDLTTLKDVIKKATEKNTSKFTIESVSQFNKALAEAQALLEQEYPLPSEVNKSIESLNDAISSLVDKKPSTDKASPNDDFVKTEPSSSSTLLPNNKTSVSSVISNIQNSIKKAKVAKLKVKSKTKKKLKITWKKISKATGYQIQLSKKKNFKNNIFNKQTTKNKITFSKKLKSKKTYFVKVRAYYTYKNSKDEVQSVYSKWSKKLKVKMK